MRSRLYQTSTIPRLDVAGVGWATQINVPKLPRDWRVRDVQILPSDEGLAVQVMVSNGQGEVMSLFAVRADMDRSEEHTSELQSLMRISYAVFCLQKKK